VYSYAPNPNNWIDPLGLRSRNKTLPINARSRNTKKLVNYINADGKKLVLMMLGKMISYLIIKMMQ